jgi:Fur family transcriptional regulator, peroxide stress response regulator
MVHVAKTEVDRRMAAFRQALRAAGVKLTHQRLEIFREVARSLEHPDAAAVFRAVQARLPTVSLDTVYRTLSLASDLGMLRTLGPHHESLRYDANTVAHHHYVCAKCGLTRDFECSALDAVEIPETLKELGSIVTMQLEVRGLCNSCAHVRAPVPESATARPRATTTRTRANIQGECDDE